MVTILPFLIIKVHKGVRNKLEYERLETQRFLRRHGITRFKANPFFPANTLMIMRGAIAARSLGGFEHYVDDMFRHIWAEPRKMDDPKIFRAVLTDAGFDANRFFELIETRQIKDELIRNTERSVERGTFGSPTFYVGDEISFGKDRLREVEATIMAFTCGAEKSDS
jgi:2-hydroxychromene-2-carboxylate isomerase